MNATTRYLSGIILLAAAGMFLLTGCKGPSGPEGPRGAQGETGAVGPAGEDGSVMYAGEDAPAPDMGTEGDYYLNTTTGEYYGPKDSEGWGSPIMVLMGEEDGTQMHSGNSAPKASMGAAGDFYLDLSSQELYGPKTESGWGSPVSLKGEAGQDGADGQDGSKIYAGQGVPDASLGVEGDFYFDKANRDLYGPKTGSGWGIPVDFTNEDGKDGSQIYSGTGAPADTLGVKGDYYLDKSSIELYGPKTSSGWGTPLNLKGADGNANVTRYIFPGHKFCCQESHKLQISNISESEMKNSAWLVYFLEDSSNTTFYYSIPGKAAGSNYLLKRSYDTGNGVVLFDLKKEATGPGETFDRIEVVRIAASNTIDNTKRLPGAVIPKSLDITSYREVADYYGFGYN